MIRLKVNPTKCELFFCSEVVDSVIADFNELSPGIKVITEDLELLGAPLTKLSTKKILSKKKSQLSILLERLSDLNHLIAYYILKHCLAVPKLIYILRTSCCLDFEQDLLDMDYNLNPL